MKLSHAAVRNSLAIISVESIFFFENWKIIDFLCFYCLYRGGPHNKTALMRRFKSWELLPISLADHEQWKKYLQSFFPSAVPISKCNKPPPSWEFSLHYIPVIYRHSHIALFIMLLNGLSLDIRPLNLTIVAFDCKMSFADSRAIICECASPSIISLRWIHYAFRLTLAARFSGAISLSLLSQL